MSLLTARIEVWRASSSILEIPQGIHRIIVQQPVALLLPGEEFFDCEEDAPWVKLF
jgi:hypothetical protein